LSKNEKNKKNKNYLNLSDHLSVEGEAQGLADNTAAIPGPQCIDSLGVKKVFRLHGGVNS